MKATQFQVVNFTEIDEGKRREILLIYALGEDGCIYEFANGRWLRIPIKDVTDFKPQSATVISKEIVR